MRLARSRHLLLVLAIAATAGGAWWLIRRRRRARVAIEAQRAEEYAFAPVRRVEGPAVGSGHVDGEEPPSVHVAAPVQVRAEAEVPSPGSAGAGGGQAAEEQPARVAATARRAATAARAPRPATSARFERPAQAIPGATAIATRPTAERRTEPAQIPTIVRSSTQPATPAGVAEHAERVDATLLQLTSRADDPLGLVAEEDDEFDAARRRSRRRVMLLAVLAVVLAAAVVVVSVDSDRRTEERREAAAERAEERAERQEREERLAEREEREAAEAAAAEAAAAEREAAPEPAAAPVPVNVPPRPIAIRTAGRQGTILVPSTTPGRAARSLVLRRGATGAPVAARLQPPRGRLSKVSTTRFARTFLISPRLTGSWQIIVTARNGEVAQGRVILPCRAKAGCRVVLGSPAVTP